MNLLFCHDAKLLEFEKQYYTNGGLTASYLNKYLNYFNNLTVFTRKIEVDEIDRNKYACCNSSNIIFRCSKASSILQLLTKKNRLALKNEIMKADFIIARLHSVNGFLAVSYAKKLNKRILIEQVGCPFDSLWNYGGLSGKILAPLFYLANKRAIKKADYVIYVSEKFLQNRYPTKAKNISCSDVNLEEFDQSILEKRLKKIETSHMTLKLGMIGSLDINFKGHEQAIKVLPLLTDSFKSVELHILGAGNKSKWVDLAHSLGVSSSIFFDGTLPSGRAVYNWMDSLDIYLIPSLQEGMPRALIEALSRALPAIGNNVGGIPELISADYIIQKKDYKSLAKKISLLATNKDKMKEQAIANFYHAHKFEKNLLETKKDKFYSEILEDIKNNA